METDVGGFFRVSIKLERRGSSFAQRNFSPFERKLRNESPKISLRATNENQFSHLLDILLTMRFGHKMTIMYLRYRNGCKNRSANLF